MKKITTVKYQEVNRFKLSFKNKFAFMIDVLFKLHRFKYDLFSLIRMHCDIWDLYFCIGFLKLDWDG